MTLAFWVPLLYRSPKARFRCKLISQVRTGDTPPRRNIVEHTFEFIDSRTHIMLQNGFRMMKGKNLIAFSLDSLKHQ